MDLSPELFDEIDAYIRNQLSPEIRSQFSQRMAENEELRQEVSKQQRLHLGLDVALRRQQAQTDAETTAVRQQFAQVRFDRQQQRRQQQRVYVIAASVALLLISSIVLLVNRLNRPATEVAFANYYQPEPRMRSDAPIATDVEAAQNDYYEGRYEKALAEFIKIPDDSLFHSTYYRGLARLALNQTDEASSDFQRARQSPDPITQRRAEWYLSLTLLRANEPQQAIQVLRQIAGNPQQPYREQAAQILRNLQ